MRKKRCHLRGRIEGWMEIRSIHWINKKKSELKSCFHKDLFSWKQLFFSWKKSKNVVVFSFSPPVTEEPKEPVDPAVRAKENWHRLYNKVLEQLREVSAPFTPSLSSDRATPFQPHCNSPLNWAVCLIQLHPVISKIHLSPRDSKVSTRSLKYVCAIHYLCAEAGYIH